MNFRYTHLAILVVFSAVIFGLLSLTGRGNINPSPSTPQASLPPKTSKCVSQNGLPDKDCTPGATDPVVTRVNIQSTICKSGYTKTVRPPVSYTNELKIEQIREYGYSDTKPEDYEEDHYLPLEVAGCGDCRTNLWPQSYFGVPNSRNKDKVENWVHGEVCSGKMTLEEGQAIFLKDEWVDVWKQIGQP